MNLIKSPHSFFIKLVLRVNYVLGTISIKNKWNTLVLMKLMFRVEREAIKKKNE